MARKKGIKYIVERAYEKEIEFSEIDFDLEHELKLGDSDNRMGVTESFSSTGDCCSWSGESYPINIDRMIKALNTLKNKHKCKYVEIMYHCDHIGYNITGLNLNIYDENTKEYKDYMTDNKKKLETKNKIEKLRKEIEKLKNIL